MFFLWVQQRGLSVDLDLFEFDGGVRRDPMGRASGVRVETGPSVQANSVEFLCRKLTLKLS